jgi:hypothetical protein
MIHQKSLQGPCQQCGTTIRYPAQLVGTTGVCPVCKQPTEFVLETPPQQPTIERRTLLWTGATILVLVLGLVGALIALKSVRDLRKQRPPGKQPVTYLMPSYETVSCRNTVVSA